MLQRTSLMSLLAAAAVLFAQPARAVPVTTDLWDVAQGTVVTANSPLIQWTTSFATNMFGGVGGAEPANTVFLDRAAAGTVHWVEWQTTAAVTVRSFSIYLAHDGTPRDARYRGVSEFRLYAYNSSTSAFDILLYDLFLGAVNSAFRYDPLGLLHPCLCALDFAANVLTEVNTNRWRAEFVQVANLDGDNDGPRVVELDGFANAIAIPEPSTLAVLGLTLVFLGGLRHGRGRITAVADASAHPFS